MISYPLLTEAEQALLPVLNTVPSQLETTFEDSTHQLWRCDTEDGLMVLKICRQESVEHSSFWLGMNELFDVDFPDSLDSAEFSFNLVREYGCLTVPQLITARAGRFVLTRYIPGQHIVEVSDESVIALARHIVSLHKQVSTTWGRLNAPMLSTQDWNKRLKQSICKLLERSPDCLSRFNLDEALAQIEDINETEFVPIMPDLRWDQLRLMEDGNLAVIDLDAFVIGPAALELVLLEYILTADQFELFKDTYQQHHIWPEYDQQRASYQLLLFLMNVLGEADLVKWMEHSHNTNSA